MSFIRPELGWLLVVDGGGAGFQGKALYRTDDGGQTWDMLFDSHGQLDHTPGSLGTPGYAVGLFFLNETDGWVTYGGAAAGHVASTRDGGRTWSLWRDVVRTSQPGYWWIWNLSFLDDEQGYLLTSQQTADPGQLMVTGDGGASWRRVPP
jgi:photosystem II stability/assembly factor-like uncharacterized protein